MSPDFAASISFRRVSRTGAGMSDSERRMVGSGASTLFPEFGAASAAPAGCLQRELKRRRQRRGGERRRSASVAAIHVSGSDRIPRCCFIRRR